MRLSDLLTLEIQAPSAPLPSTRALERSVERVLKRWPDIFAESSNNDRERLVQDLKHRVEANHWKGARISFINQAAQALFDEERQGRPDLAALRRFYLNEISEPHGKAFLGNAFQVYIRSFQRGAAHTIQLANALRSAKSRLQERNARLIANFPRLLDPAHSARDIAERMQEMVDPFHELKSLGVAKPHEPGLMDAVHLAYLRHLAPQLNTLVGAKRLICWLKPEGQPPRHSGAAEAIEALLRPWLNATPGKDFQQYLIETLSELYGDLRLNPGGVWSNVSQAVKDILYHWLTGESIRFLFDVLTEVEETHMWAERRQFWMAQYEKGNIKGAWVAFGREGERLARRRLDHNGSMPFGRQTAGGSDRNKSLLIMQIGQRIFIEGTSNFKIHVYAKNDPDAPRLYQATYSCETIRHGKYERTRQGVIRRKMPEFTQMHHSSWHSRMKSKYPELL